ncbi:HD domain-containing protein [Nocardia terpenica]|uniref:HD domain-containing protein n=1 Tax=Nocardia terpenica TaxID=455432 RepID=A0A6G9ZAZ5_9NOCA|nr:HD domain-containing protein [Nocardia terpenica]QIS22561.1 HD domain-containing protein [Nocardia terpenica]
MSRSSAALPALPSTPLADAADRLLADTLSAPLRNHSIRGYLFGLALAERRGLCAGRDFDDETMFLICALHDIALSGAADDGQRFEVHGADRAARFLEERGVADERVDMVWDGIAAHTSGFVLSPVYRRRRPAAISLAVDGIGVDVFGGPGDLPPGYADRVHAVYPRLGGVRPLTDAIVAHATDDPRRAPVGSLAGEIVRQRYPESGAPTWDDMSGGGWGD